MRAKLQRGQGRAAQRRHHPIPEQGTMARQRRPRALRLLRRARQQRRDQSRFHDQVTRHWYWSLKRAASATRCPGRGCDASRSMAPTSPTQHPFPNARFDANTQGRSPVR